MRWFLVLMFVAAMLFFACYAFCDDYSVVTDGVANIKWKAPDDTTDIEGYTVYIYTDDGVLKKDYFGVEPPPSHNYKYTRDMIVTIYVCSFRNVTDSREEKGQAKIVAQLIVPSTNNPNALTVN